MYNPKPFQHLCRPIILVRAARAAIGFASENGVLRRATHGRPARMDRRTLAEVLALEDALNTQRKTGHSDYAMARHIDALAALMVLQRDVR